MGSRNPIDAAPTLRRGGSDSTVARTCRATGEALLVPARNRRSRVGRITGETGKSAEDERVAAGSAVAMKRSNVRRAKGPCHLQHLRRKEGKDEMTKASIDLQDLRRRIYVKVKAKLPRRFWINTFVCSGAKGLGWERWIRQSRKSPQQDRSHKPWHEANGRAQCGKSACCVTVLSLPPRRVDQPYRSVFGWPFCLR